MEFIISLTRNNKKDLFLKNGKLKETNPNILPIFILLLFDSNFIHFIEVNTVKK